MDALKNFAYSTVATPPSPATSGTSLVVASGQGALFPAAPFDATIWPAGVQPLSTNAEIVRVTAVATDTFTITRAQYGTTAQSITAGYQIAQTIDANLLNQLASLSGATFTGQVSVPDIQITGITGATAGNTRLVGTTASGAPTTGTFSAGDAIIDQTGTIWFCITGGTPGTWTNEIPNSLVVRSATATAGVGEFTIFGISGTSGQTITLPANPQNGAIYQIKNLSAYTVNILGGTNSISVSGTLYGASTPYTIPLNAAYTFVYTGGVWFCFTTTDINKMGGLPLAISGGGTGLSSIGSNNTVLTSNGTTASWQAPAASGLSYLMQGQLSSTNSQSATITLGASSILMLYAGTNGATFTVGQNAYTYNVPANSTVSTSTLIASGSNVTVQTSYTGTISTGFSSSTLPSSSAWSGVTYGNGYYVAVASGTTAGAYSTNGTSWTASTMPSSRNWDSVTYGNGYFVAVASGTTTGAYSTNGTTWTASTMPSSLYWTGVTYGNGTFVAVASGYTTGAYSTNGTSWTASTMPSNAAWTSIAYGNGTFVAVAGGPSTSGAYSTNGTTWTACTLAQSGSWDSVTWGNGIFVAVASQGYNTYSINGINWNNGNINSSYSWNCVTYGGGNFVAVSSNGNVAYSVDGNIWTSSTATNANFTAITWGNGYFVTVANGPSTVANYFKQTAAHPVTYTVLQGPTSVY